MADDSGLSVADPPSAGWLGDRWVAAVLGAIAVLTAWDLLTDLGQGVGWPHAVVEVTVAVLAGCGAVLILLQVRNSRRLARLARDQAAAADARALAANAEAQRWRQEAAEVLAGLGRAIAQQLQKWQLTTAEQAIALLLLRGLSLKQIAAMRDVAEATVRQQARGIYKKAGVEGRHDLAAFFLAGLLLPNEVNH